MKNARWLGPVLASLLLGWLGRLLLQADVDAAFLAKSMVVVVGLPWILGAVGSSLRDLAGAFGDGLRQSRVDAGSAARSRVLLENLGSATLATGVVVALAGLTAGLNDIARTGGQANPYELLPVLGRMLVPVALAFALRLVLYDPLASALERADAPR